MCNESITKNLGPGPPGANWSGCAPRTYEATGAACIERIEQPVPSCSNSLPRRVCLINLMLCHRDEKCSRSRGSGARRWRCGFVASDTWGKPTDGIFKYSDMKYAPPVSSGESETILEEAFDFSAGVYLRE